MKITISNFKENDKEALSQIYFNVRHANFIWLEHGLSSFNQDTAGEFILVARVDDEIVGFASVWLMDNFLHHLYIANHFQRKGIGTMLLNRIIKNSDSDVTLKCLKRNSLGIKFYRKRGWESISEGTSNEGEYILFKYRITDK